MKAMLGYNLVLLFLIMALERMMEKTLILGYGNVDRQDDGVAWHVMAQVALDLGLPAPASVDKEFTSYNQTLDFLFELQLTPELGETLAEYRRVCFIDAHTGRIPEEVRLSSLKSEFQASPFTHHMTPETCLAIAANLYGEQPEAVLVSVRGYEFGFSRSLSAPTAQFARQAARLVLDWLVA